MLREACWHYLNLVETCLRGFVTEKDSARLELPRLARILNFFMSRVKIIRGMRFPTMCMCDQQSLRSACAYAQSDQSLC